MSHIKQKCSQNTLIWLCFFVYTFAYFGRYGYNANISMIMADHNINHAQAGIVTTCFFFAYGIGQVVNGFMCKRYNKNYLFPLVLFASSVLNLLILVIPFEYFKFLWLLNGFLQSCLWSSIISVLGENLDEKHLSRALFIMSMTATIGTVLTYGSSALFVWMGNYKIIFYFAPVAMMLIGILWLLLFRSGQKKAEVSDKETEQSKNGGFKAIMIVFAALAFFAIVDNLVKDGLNTWVPAILTEEYGMKDEVSILSSVVLPILGTFGALLSIYLNKYIKDFVALSTVLFALSAVFIYIIMSFGQTSAFLMIVCFGIVVCMMHGVNNVITAIAPLKMRDRAEPGKIAGVLNGFCYLGSTLSSYGLGAIADHGGWHMVFMLLFVLSIVCMVLGGLYIAFKRKNK